MAELGETRPHWTALTLVGAEHVLFRFVRPDHINSKAVEGARVQISALQTNEFTPNDHSYGASVYIKELLPGGLEDLHAACPKWKTWLFSEVPVGDVNALGVDVRMSPNDCQFESIKHAHASLLNVTKSIRPSLIRLIEKHLIVLA